MLYVFTGQDSIATRARAHEFLDAYETKGSRSERIDTDMCTAELLRDRIGARSLFLAPDTPNLFFLDTPSEQAGALEVIVAFAKQLAESSNVFVLLEGQLPASIAKGLKQHAQKYEEVVGAVSAEKFNVFALADALARRDRKSLWILLLRAQSAGLSPEEIVGTLFWQVKMMRLAAKTKSADEAGMKPFVYAKAKSGARKFGEDGTDDLSRALLMLYHDAHLGKLDLDIALERWVLHV